MYTAVVTVLDDGTASTELPHSGDDTLINTTGYSAEEYTVLFHQYCVTHVDSRQGMENDLYGDLRDGVYTVEEWLEWLETIE